MRRCPVADYRSIISATRINVLAAILPALGGDICVMEVNKTVAADIKRIRLHSSLGFPLIISGTEGIFRYNIYNHINK